MDQQKPILIYYKMRGAAQIIRYVFYQIGAQFIEQFTTNEGFPQLCAKYNLEIRSLAYVVHEGFVIHGNWPIIKYLCTKFNRLDLLGKNLEDQIRVSQVTIKFLAERRKCVETILKVIKAIKKVKQGEKNADYIKAQVDEFTKTTKFYQACKKMFGKSRSFLRGYLTVIDFIFFELCLTLLAIAGKENIKDPTVTEYVNFFQTTQYYSQKKQLINQYPILPSQLNETIELVLNYQQNSG